MMVTVTESAQAYLRELLDKQDGGMLGIRVFVNSPGTPKAETCIAYCRQEDVQEGDDKLELSHLVAYIDERSIPFLEDALVDYSKDRMGGQLTIKAPNSKTPYIDESSPLEDRINYILYDEINPSLASHGGEVSLLEVTDNKVAILKFGGGCQGCSAVDITLKHGVEKTLLERIPELTAINDETDHSDNASAYM
ncbi:MAG: Fe/S biogenesis protein NfuA [Candidatus Azotimanducaceae bacterium]|jgi:Fe/S biogenesis protein NfuA